MTEVNHPEFDFPVNYSTGVLSGGNSGQVSATIDMMRRYTVEDSTRPEFVQALNEYMQGKQFSSPGEVSHGFARSMMRFQRDEVTGGPLDPDVVEVLIRPVDVVLMFQQMNGGKVPGDCDCFSMCVACTLQVLGVPSAFVTIAGDDPNSFSHVYVVAYPCDLNARMAVDASHGAYAGWEGENLGQYAEWPLLGGGNQTLTILGFLLAAAGIWWYVTKGGL